MVSAATMGVAEPKTDTQRPTPILTRPAATAQSISIIANAKYFDDVQLEEANEFDGFGSELELTVPFRQNMQLRFILPVYTSGKATLIDPPTGERIRIKGPSGTFNYPTILFDHQLMDEKSDGYNLAYFLGYGKSAGNWGKLDTTHGDIYNHQGNLFRIGLKADGSADSGAYHWLTNAGVRIYQGSDDLNPAQTGDNFAHLELSGAVIFNHVSDHFYPAAELSYQGDLGRYNAIHLIPQIIAPIGPNLDLKAGATLGLSGDGERWGARLQLDYRL
ncbi:MAG: hypothetical protein EA353_05285 [Puniceicoccaceae bacterium]|nr:MAG: hypothetical protein EA353_05285 [Puniceicoccaceae bacterium]